MTYVENNPVEWKPEKDGDLIEGVLLSIQKDVGANKSLLYTIEKDNKPFSVWGSVILDQRMQGVKIGDKIIIEFKGLGEAKAGHNAPKIFKVLVDRP